MPSLVKRSISVLAVFALLAWGLITIPAARSAPANVQAMVGQPIFIQLIARPSQQVAGLFVSVEESDRVLQEAFDRRQGDIQVEGQGRISRVLSDDLDGSRHQRFIVKLQSGLTVLIAHNIDLAPRVASVREGDDVRFFGEYEWNPQGGVIHWTHQDPHQQHVDGWIEHRGQRYQ